MMHRAYSLLDVKAVEPEQRIITGTATTPAPDRLGDIIEPLGVRFKNPLPLLWQHNSREPVGTVRFDKPTAAGITFKATMPKVAESGPLKDRIDTAWGELQHGLVRGASIGFRAIEHSYLDDGGVHFLKTEVLELSLVTIPANQDATIESIRSFDTAQAASGQSRTNNPAGVSASSKTVKVMETKTMAKKTLAEQISAFENTRAAKAARLDEIMDAAADKSETLDAAAKEEYDGLESELKEIDGHLVRLRAREKLNREVAVEVRGADQQVAAQSRGGVRVENVRANLYKGAAFTRFALALMRANGNRMEAVEIAKNNKQWAEQTPEIIECLKAAAAAGTTTDATWAGPLVQYQYMSAEFIEYLRPRTIIGRIPGLRMVPFKVKVPRQTAVASVNWVGENKPKPVSQSAFDTVTLDITKIAGIIALTEELVRLSSPAAETLARDDLASGIIQLMDQDFIDPDKAAVANVSPASLINGVTPTVASGTAYSNFVTDFKATMQKFLDVNMSPEGMVILMRHDLALAMSLMLTSLGQAVFPQLTMDGGTLAGMPVITSQNIQYTEDSPQEGSPIIFVKPGEILLADDGQVMIDISREASVQMNDAPDSPATASTVLVSLWQHNLIGVRAERAVNWVKRRPQAAQFISAARYA